MYKDEKECLKCGHKEYLSQSKIDAAFESDIRSNFWKSPCINCGEEKEFCGLIDKPEIDNETFSIWIKDDKRFFQRQDEDMYIGDSVDERLVNDSIANTEVSLKKKIIMYNALLFKAMDTRDEFGSNNSRFLLIISMLKEHSYIIDLDRDNDLWSYMLEDLAQNLGIGNG